MMSDDDRADESSKKSREHHNFVERKRRDLIKESFKSLKDTVPSLKDVTPASRAKILRKASEYIQHMKNKNESHQQDIDNLRRQNDMLEYQINQLQRIEDTSKYTQQQSNLALVTPGSDNTKESEGELQKSKIVPKKKNFCD